MKSFAGQWRTSQYDVGQGFQLGTVSVHDISSPHLFSVMEVGFKRQKTFNSNMKHSSKYTNNLIIFKYVRHHK